MRIGIQCEQEIQQLDHIETTATAFDLRHKTLRPIESSGYVPLKQAALLAQVG
jgi:hypothetical protein